MNHRTDTPRKYSFFVRFLFLLPFLLLLSTNLGCADEQQPVGQCNAQP